MIWEVHLNTEAHIAGSGVSEEALGRCHSYLDERSHQIVGALPQDQQLNKHGRTQLRRKNDLLSLTEIRKKNACYAGKKEETHFPIKITFVL